MTRTTPSLAARCCGEIVGTFLLVFFGCGAVHAAVLTGAQSGLWQVAIVWGVAIMLAAFTVGAVSGAHINPAITLALAVWGRFPWRPVAPYIVSQLIGAMFAAGLLCYVFQTQLTAKEAEKEVVRGQPGSVVTAMCYGEYYPSPAPLAGKPGGIRPGQLDSHWGMVDHSPAFIIEFVGTLILALVVFAVSDERNAGAPLARLGPVAVGLTVAALISVIAPLTQACFNPARDFGPRLVAYLAGWGEVALPGPNGSGFFTVYILAPVLGAVAGGGLYARLIQPSLAGAAAVKED
jgi:glycerol uptake facilitator protein